MEGVILNPPNKGEGVARCADGQRFTFELSDWRSEEPPAAGDRVDFVPEGNRATEIYCTAAGPTHGTPVQTAAPQTSALAIVSLVAGILGLIWFGSIIAVICGHIARSNIRNSEGALNGDGLAVAGLILGYIGLVIGLVILLVIGGIGLWGFSMS